MARPCKGMTKRKRDCRLCKPWRAAGDGRVHDTAACERRDPLAFYRHVGYRLALPGGQREVMAYDEV